jgi:hypothetical protein
MTKAKNWSLSNMYKKPTQEDRLNAASIREQIGHSLRNYYQACITNEVPPRLLAALKKLDEGRPEPGEHVQAISGTKN